MKYFSTHHRVLRSSLTAASLLLVPSLLLAHPGHDAGAGGFAYGFLHPFSGLDHLIAMIAIGIWAGSRREDVRWGGPITSIGMMAFGSLLPAIGVTLPFVEEGIVASVLILGLMIAAAVRMPGSVALPLIGFFALFHGYAHAAEMPAAASGLVYVSGILISTTLLHVGGILLALSSHRFGKEAFIRYAGFCIAAIGVALIVG